MIKGQFSFPRLVQEILSIVGPSEVLMSAWVAPSSNLGEAFALIADRRVEGMRWLVDHGFARDHGQFLESVEKRHGDDSVRLVRCHTKYAALRGGSADVVIRTSRNLSDSPNLDIFDVSFDSAEWGRLLWSISDAAVRGVGDALGPVLETGPLPCRRTKKAKAPPLDQLLDPTTEALALTCGRYSLIDVVGGAIERAGDNPRVVVSAWSAGEPEITAISESSRSRWLIDTSYLSLKPRGAALLERLETRYALNHAKWVTVRGTEGEWAIRSSMNPNRNHRTEQIEICSDPALLDFLDRFTDHVWLAIPEDAVRRRDKVTIDNAYRAMGAMDSSAIVDTSPRSPSPGVDEEVLDAGSPLENVEAAIAAVKIQAKDGHLAAVDRLVRLEDLRARLTKAPAAGKTPGIVEGQSSQAFGVRLPTPMVRDLDRIAEDRRVSRTQLVETALRRWLDGQEPDHGTAGGGGEVRAKLAAISVAIKRETGVYPSHPRILELYQEIRDADVDLADPDRMADKIALAEAILYEALERMARQAEALEAWAIEGYGKPPAALLDPIALVPLIDAYRKLVQAVYKNRLVDAMTRAEVMGVLERYGAAIKAGLEPLRLELEGTGVDAEELCERILDRIAAGGRELLLAG